ncbi:phage virion morphogenesis protein [Dysgonomonas sp. ZJ709]|uniref:phage virion morphogenesis protein n=1 Tax=Dysgonomonas sp. ZJ709 TaxID=2709797 RepID=UPI0013EDCC45|nr:phage virion morphogenesis protein [Dysgonomonas sp. ZJ709]
MDIQEYARLFPQKMKEINDFVQGNDIKDILGREALSHFKESFTNEGFTDETLEPWQDVKRRDEDSDWYGHSSTGRFSDARTSANILTGETSVLQKGLSYKLTDTGARITSVTGYGRVHQFGLYAKIYGKTTFQMPTRPFMGYSAVLEANIKDKIKREIINIMTR